MLDKRCSALLDIINAECVGAGYKVMGIDELKLAMPSAFTETTESVLEHLSYLSEREYISVKYQDENEVCLVPLTKGRLVTENRIEQEVENTSQKRAYFAYAFLGAFSASLLGVIICLLILLFGGGYAF